MSGRYRPARAIRPGWRVRLATGGEWMPVLARIDTVTDDGQERIWLLSADQITVAHADDWIFSRPPDETTAHAS